jgi:hypothetical protein
MKLFANILAGAVLAAGLTVALPACQSKVPGDASLVASGIGDTWYIAHDTGMLYVYDKSWNKMVYAGEVHRGQRVELSAHRDKLLVDGLPRVEHIPLGEGSEYQFFLRPDPRIARRTVIHTVPTDRRTVIETVPTERRTVIETVPQQRSTVIEVR